MANRLKEMGETAAWRLMVSAALEGAKQQGFSLQRQPGRGLSNTYLMSKDDKSSVASVRTTRDRWIAFPPLEDGARWKTLDDVDHVLVSAVDDPGNPQNVDVYLFPANEVRNRFDASYAARTSAGHKVRDNYGMWVMLDGGDPTIISQVGHGLAVDYPAIARFTIDELQEKSDPNVGKKSDFVEAIEDEADMQEAQMAGASLDTVADVLSFARDRIAVLTGMSPDSFRLDLKMTM